LIASLGLLLLLAAPDAGGAPTWRLDADPQDAAEAALHEAATRDGAAATGALVALGQQFRGPHRPASGTSSPACASWKRAAPPRRSPSSPTRMSS